MDRRHFLAAAVAALIAGKARRAAAAAPRNLARLGRKRTNKCTNTNVNPQSASGVSIVSGSGALSVVDDAAELAAIGLAGNAYKLDNSGQGASCTVNITGMTASLNVHTASCWVRGSGNAQVAVSNEGFNVSALTSGYVRRSSTVTPGAATNLVKLVAAAGAVLYFVGNQLEEGGVATSLIAVAGAARTAWD